MFSIIEGYLLGPLSHPRMPSVVSFGGLSFILASNDANLGSDRKVSNLGSTPAHASQLDRSWKALSSQVNDSSLSPRPIRNIAIQ